tara:strand:- start:3203 stop:4525 length:1323 start_codon:yes stop_codon:yes gene_type:complete
MLKLSSRYYYLRHENEIQRFLSENSNWIHIINKENSFKNFTNSKENLFLIDLNSNLSNQIQTIEDQKFDLIIITDIFEVTDDIYGLLNSLNKLLTNNGKVLINSINTKWNFFLLFFEFFKIKKISRPRSYIHLKKIYSISESSGFEMVKSFTRQIFPFRLFGIGNLLNTILEIIFFKFNIGINNYLLLSKTNKEQKVYSKTIIVPAKNEELNLEPIINRIPLFESDYEILLVCAKSSDNTVETAYEIQQKYKKLPIKIIEQKSKGKGPGVLEAIEVSNFEIITILDSDLSVDPETLNEFFEIIENGRADFVNGTRFVYKMEEGAMRKLNSIGNLFFQYIISIVISTKLTDSLCGTKVFKKDLINQMSEWKSTLFIKDPFGDFDFIFSAAYSGHKILEYPVHYRARVYGTTQISRFSDGIKLLFYFINSLIMFNISKNVKK